MEQNDLLGLGGLLTSGYLPFHEQADAEATKCAFGGTNDAGTNTGSVGAGINKATGNTCFSPHADSHVLAAEMAVEVGWAWRWVGGWAWRWAWIMSSSIYVLAASVCTVHNVKYCCCWLWLLLLVVAAAVVG